MVGRRRAGAQRTRKRNRSRTPSEHPRRRGTVTVVKDLKIKGSSTVIKVGTKVRGIRLVSGVGDHDIDCKVDGVGPMQLKSSVVKKI